MGTYRQEMDKLKLSEQKKKQLKGLYAAETKKEEYSMRRLVKPFVAVAACAAILLGSVVSGNLALRRSEDGGTQANASDHDFSIIVSAAELTEETPAVVCDPGKGDGWVLCGTENEREVSYSVSAMFACEGDEIESITYRINQGAFQIFMPAEAVPELTYTEADPINVPATGWPEGYEQHFASTYTVDYAKQHPENISICGIKQIERTDELFGDSVEGEKAGMEELFKDLVITCTVTFTDKTEVSKEIILSPVIMTNREGNPQGSQLDAIEHGGEADFEAFLDKEAVFLVYELR